MNNIRGGVHWVHPSERGAETRGKEVRERQRDQSTRDRRTGHKHTLQLRQGRSHRSFQDALGVGGRRAIAARRGSGRRPVKQETRGTNRAVGQIVHRCQTNAVVTAAGAVRTKHPRQRAAQRGGRSGGTCANAAVRAAQKHRGSGGGSERGRTEGARCGRQGMQHRSGGRCWARGTCSPSPG